MNYKAFYRTYRPSKFSEVVGQDHVVKTLVNLIKMDKISHGYLFAGPRGTGKTSIAKIFANAINCIHTVDKEDICDRCLNNANKTIDIVEIDAASNNSVNDIRNIKDKIEFAPTNSPYKIFIIDEVHMLTKGAFNALLKTLEEPPAHIILIFATTEPDKVPDTIMSRLQRYNFKRISKDTLEKQLKFVFEKEKVKCDAESISMIASLANGSLRDALSIADQINAYSNSNIKISDLVEIFGLSTIEAQIHLINLVASKLVSEALEFFDNLVNNGVDINKLIVSLIELLKDYLIYSKTNNQSLISTSISALKTIVLKVESVHLVLDILTPLLNEIKYSDIPHQLMQLAIIKICSLENKLIDSTKEITTIESLRTTNSPQQKTNEVQKQEQPTINESFVTSEEEFVFEKTDGREYKDITDEYFSKTNTTKTILADFSNEKIEQNFNNLLDDFSLDKELSKANQKDIDEQIIKKTINNSLDSLEHKLNTLELNNSNEENIIDQTTELLNISHEGDGSNQEINESLLNNYDTSKQVFDTNEIDVSQSLDNNLLSNKKTKTFAFVNQYEDEENEIPLPIKERFTKDENYNQKESTKEFRVDQDVENKNISTSPININSPKLNHPSIINLFLLSNKETFEIFKRKLTEAKASVKEEYDSFAILVRETEFVCSANDFILISSQEDWVIEDINNKINDSTFKQYVSEYFGSNTHFYAITKKDYKISKELFAELKKANRIPEAKPLKQISNISDGNTSEKETSLNEMENKSKSLFGSLFSRKKE